MGILESKQPKAVSGTKRRSTQLDFSNLTPLKPGGTVGFSAFRDGDASSSSKKVKSRKSVGGAMDEDSEEEDDEVEIVANMEDADDKDVKTLLTAEDAKFSGELAAGVDRIKVILTPYLYATLLIICFSSSVNILLKV